MPYEHAHVYEVRYKLDKKVQTRLFTIGGGWLPADCWIRDFLRQQKAEMVGISNLGVAELVPLPEALAAKRSYAGDLIQRELEACYQFASRLLMRYKQVDPEVFLLEVMQSSNEVIARAVVGSFCLVFLEEGGQLVAPKKMPKYDAALLSRFQSIVAGNTVRQDGNSIHLVLP